MIGKIAYMIVVIVHITIMVFIDMVKSIWGKSKYHKFLETYQDGKYANKITRKTKKGTR